jgi:2-dehydro-3-deoxyphosphogluconate aldolase/(4S)-4-hydroxy-2-oxoglutarate aldolase
MIQDTGLVPVFFNNNINLSIEIVKACYLGGSRIIEFTNRGEKALHVFSDLVDWCGKKFPDCILGAGTIIESATAVSYINNGAGFIVGPVFNPQIAKLCNRRKVLYIPGCQTPTEISEAEELGVDIIKLFPANILTPKFIKALHGPMPRSLIMPSGGLRIDQEEITKWIKAGAVALNIGSNLIQKKHLMEGNFEEIKGNVQRCLKWIRKAREKQGV